MMMLRLHARPLLVCLSLFMLAGCELLPDEPLARRPDTPVMPVDTGCHAPLPDFDDEACLLPDWVAFGLAAQRGDGEWRDDALERLDGDDPERRLARAVALSWGSERQWERAAELYKADLHAAPTELQPLLRYWLNELEGRRSLAGDLEASRQEREALAEENEELAEKLEALTAIERNINLRQQID
jgi:hypothetical protein